MNLEQLQRVMASAVMLPLTDDEQMQMAAPDGRAMAAVAEEFIAPNSRLSAFERLEIYNRQYWFRLLGALQEDFPALESVVGSRAFEALSIAYLTAHPSRSFTLRNLGSHLTAWLQSNPQFAGRRHRLALDVTRVEWAFVEAFDGAERAPLTVDQIATLDGDSRLALQPHLRLVALEYPADDLVLALHQRERQQSSEAGVKREQELTRPAKPGKIRRRATWVAAHRVDLAVFYRRLEKEEFQMLAAIRNSAPLGDAIAAGFAGSRIADARRGHHLRTWFGNWGELGWICAPELENLL